MSSVSPFLLKKVIQNIAGDVLSCTKIRDGTVLVKTKNVVQAGKLIKLVKLSPEVNVLVEEHKTLNEVKGVFYSPDLQYVSDEEFLNEMKDQKIIEIKRFKRKTDNAFIETGLYCVKFSVTKLPNEIFIGYQRYSVRPFIPLPLRCMKCLNFNHLTENCKKEKMCSNCGELYHLIDNEKCAKPEKCVNCKDSHNAFYKKCPRFLKEKEIKTIKIKENVDMKEAIRRYNMRFPFVRPLSEILNNQKQVCRCKCSCNNKITDEDKISDKSKIVFGDDMKKNEHENKIENKPIIQPIIQPINPSANITKSITLENGNIILPKNLSKKQKREIKKQISKNKKPKTDEKDDSSTTSSIGDLDMVDNFE
ncbi:uncharacterized protein LOC129609900 [Condylostylus longicornis]|uniref:uncharacterized protein LOC129609900 n=1 Tax=Condylostylus longicornis TaxID=2530218 RepID=UPI00244DB1B3|nr:uncharacterized protein LOC129609900 [Condylostylus longicornis]